MKTLRITNESLCTGCKLCVLACSRKMGKGVSLNDSHLRVSKTDEKYKVIIDLGKMTPELSEYISYYCPQKLLEARDDN